MKESLNKIISTYSELKEDMLGLYDTLFAAYSEMRMLTIILILLSTTLTILLVYSIIQLVNTKRNKDLVIRGIKREIDNFFK